MRVDSVATAGLALTAGLVTGIVGFKASESRFRDMEGWKAGAVALGTGVPGLIGGFGVSNALYAANAFSVGKTAGFVGAGAIVGALLGVGFAAAARLDATNRP